MQSLAAAYKDRYRYHGFPSSSSGAIDGADGISWEAVASVTVPMVEVVHAGVAATAGTTVFRDARVDR